MTHEGERPSQPGKNTRNGAGNAPVARRRALTPREREVLALLADGLSGARIAERLVLSPETVRTHVRNAMATLDATTRSQAVAIALRDEQIPGDSRTPTNERLPDGGPDETARVALHQLVQDMVALYDLDAGAVYIADDDGLALQRVATTGPDPELPESIALGHGPLGRTALERRAQLVRGGGGGALLAAPIQGGGRLLGVIALDARVSRPIGRTELLLLQALSSRVGDVLATGSDVSGQLEQAMKRFRASWAAQAGP